MSDGNERRKKKRPALRKSGTMAIKKLEEDVNNHSNSKTASNFMEKQLARTLSKPQAIPQSEAWRYLLERG